MDEEELRQWVRRLGEGSEEAFSVVYEETKEHVYRLVSYLTGGGLETDDIVSEVYLELIRAVETYDASRPFRPWLNGLVVRQTGSWNRKRWRKLRLLDRSRMLLDRHPAAPGTDGRLLRDERREELRELVGRLPYKLRSVIVLKYYQECTYEEISRLLDIPVGTAKSRHHKALAQLRRRAELAGEIREGGLFHVH
ncbi:RNA polymerase sigma factor [Paenibacillus sp. J31TS4]|uniref:sigma-70 family RNA polymerase sigma factor n=1 Tax=Paenibacillus sp. J31TS4 TaxID=2807195 RepID=UPI001B0DA000|nr:sigma-70 family RNA polymerase sigma factor [Paenibacillus sp. J31TS4]GIP38049.1 RNA polymerase sigma factor [Paenibacillus sp. J31TS4]